MKIKSKDKHPNTKPLKRAHFIFNFPLGLFFGAGAALIFAWFIDAEVAAVIDSKYSGPLISAAFTLIAAILALLGARWTIQSQRDIVQEDRERKLAAARATLPLVLSEFSDVCDAHVKHLADDTMIADRAAKLSAGAQETLKLVIEHADDELQKELSELLQFYQLCISRLNILTEHEEYDPPNDTAIRLRKYERASAIINWLSLQALLLKQFEFARAVDPEDTLFDPRQVFERNLHSCRGSSSLLLTNDSIFEQMFGSAIENKESGFFKPNYYR